MKGCLSHLMTFAIGMAVIVGVAWVVGLVLPSSGFLFLCIGTGVWAMIGVAHWLSGTGEKAEGAAMDLAREAMTEQQEEATARGVDLVQAWVAKMEKEESDPSPPGWHALRERIEQMKARFAQRQAAQERLAVELDRIESVAAARRKQEETELAPAPVAAAAQRSFDVESARRKLLARYPAVSQADTPENRAFVAYARTHGERAAHAMADMLMAEVARAKAGQRPGSPGAN